MTSHRDVRLFILCQTLMKNVLSTDDWRGAYLQTDLRSDKVHIILPKDVQSDREKAMKMPVRQVLKSIYGLERAGHDFDHSASQCLEQLKWRSLRRWDSIPALYIRGADGEVVSHLKDYSIDDFERDRYSQGFEKFLDLVSLI